MKTMATEAVAERLGHDGGLAPAPRAPSADALSAGFQLGYIARFGLAVIAGATAAGLVVCGLLAGDLGTYAQNVTIINGVQEWVFAAAALSALIQLALTGVLASALALVASHKVAGPTVRLVRALRGIGEGKLPGPVRFRHGDQVGRLEGDFNALARLLRQRHQRLVRNLDEARDAQEELRRLLRGQASGQERPAAARELRRRADELARLLADAAGTE